MPPRPAFIPWTSSLHIIELWKQQSIPGNAWDRCRWLKINRYTPLIDAGLGQPERALFVHFDTICNLTRYTNVNQLSLGSTRYVAVCSNGLIPLLFLGDPGSTPKDRIKGKGETITSSRQ
jgi:hypothetical protein